MYAAGESEKVMGEAFKRFAWPRSSYVVSTKLYWGGKGPNSLTSRSLIHLGVNERGLSRKHIIEGLNASLQRLQLVGLESFSSISNT